MSFKSNIKFVCILCIVLSTLALASESARGNVALQANDAITEVPPILETNWGQHDYYNAFTPVNNETGNHERLGCWSVAIAQILNHLKLQAHGYQYYKGDMYTITENLNYRFNWDYVATDLDDNSPELEKIETALFCYFVSVVVQANFGPGDYIGNSDSRRFELHAHFPCTTGRVSTSYHTRQRIEDFITEELIHNRPLMLYVTPHAMVIDGYRKVNGQFEVHINFGWAGVDNGWYRLWSEIHTSVYDMTDPGRWVMAIIPKHDDITTKIEADPITRGPILNTIWGPDNAYALYAPIDIQGGHEELGNWSVAIAQMIAHIQLQPVGTQHYVGTNYIIDQAYDSIDWRLLSTTINAATPSANRVETAKFIWYVATIIKKDFGTASYMGNSDVRRSELAEHFPCSTRRYKTGSDSNSTIESRIIDEITCDRPVMLLLEGQNDLSRAVVIDGYNANSDGNFYVHLNFGDYGNDNGWYSFWDDIRTSLGLFDNPSRWIMTIQTRQN